MLLMFSQINRQIDGSELSTPLNFGDGIVWQEFTTKECATLYAWINKQVRTIACTVSYHLAYAYNTDDNHVIVLEHGEQQTYTIFYVSKESGDITTIHKNTKGIAISKNLKYMYNYAERCVYKEDKKCISNVYSIPISLYDDCILAWNDEDGNINVRCGKRLLKSKCNFTLDYLFGAECNKDMFVVGGFCHAECTLVLYVYTYDNNRVVRTSSKQFKETAYAGEKMYTIAPILRDGGFYLFAENHGGGVEYQQFTKNGYPSMMLTSIGSDTAYSPYYNNGMLSFISNDQIWWTLL